MAMTGAQRQVAYRARRDSGEGERRLNAWISVKAALALKRLARHQGVTAKEMMERLIVEADAAVLRGLELETAGWDDYFAVTR
jgi:hypothetical protein